MEGHLYPGLARALAPQLDALRACFDPQHPHRIPAQELDTPLRRLWAALRALPPAALPAAAIKQEAGADDVGPAAPHGGALLPGPSQGPAAPPPPAPDTAPLLMVLALEAACLPQFMAALLARAMLQRDLGVNWLAVVPAVRARGQAHALELPGPVLFADAAQARAVPLMTRLLYAMASLPRYGPLWHMHGAAAQGPDAMYLHLAMFCPLCSLRRLFASCRAGAAADDAADDMDAADDDMDDDADDDAEDAQSRAVRQHCLGILRYAEDVRAGRVAAAADRAPPVTPQQLANCLPDWRLPSPRMRDLVAQLRWDEMVAFAHLASLDRCPVTRLPCESPERFAPGAWHLELRVRPAWRQARAKLLMKAEPGGRAQEQLDPGQYLRWLLQGDDPFLNDGLRTQAELPRVRGVPLPMVVGADTDGETLVHQVPIHFMVGARAWLGRAKLALVPAGDVSSLLQLAREHCMFLVRHRPGVMSDPEAEQLLAALRAWPVRSLADHPSGGWTVKRTDFW